MKGENSIKKDLRQVGHEGGKWMGVVQVQVQ